MSVQIGCRVSGTGGGRMTPDELRARLQAEKVSQRELARRLRCNPATVFRWAKGDRAIDGIAETAILCALGKCQEKTSQ